MCVQVGYSNLISGMSLRPSAWELQSFLGKEPLNCHLVRTESGKGKAGLQPHVNLMTKPLAWPPLKPAPGPRVAARASLSCIWEVSAKLVFGLRSSGVVLQVLTAFHTIKLLYLCL